MKEYSEILTFNFRNKLFKLFIDKNGNRFYMQTDSNDNLLYANIDDYVEIDNILSNPYIPMIQPLVMDNQYNSYDKNKYEINNDYNKNKYHKKHNIIPKVIISGVAVLLTPTLLGFYIKHNQDKYNHVRLREREQTNYEESISTEITETSTYDPNEFDTSAAARRIPKNLDVDTFFDNGSIYYIYDTSYFDKTTYGNKPTLIEVESAINLNGKIPDSVKPVIINYAEDLFKTYPDIDCRNFIENIRTLDVEVCSQSEIKKYTFGDNALGCYIRGDNKICVLDTADYKNDMWAKQTIYHELSHCFRNGDFNKNGRSYVVRFSGLGLSNDIVEESLNSLFAVSLFGYEEKDIAYQLQSNMTKIMVESMDNYSIEDYANHSLSYYAQKLDEFNGDDNYATTMLALMAFQYDDFHTDRINAAQSEYYPLYEYISNMYYKKYLNKEMSYEEAKLVADRLVEELMFDVPEDYNIDVNYFYTYFDNYCNQIGIQTPTKKI